MLTGIILTSVALLMIVSFVLYCLVWRRQDAIFALLNLFRHKRRSFSTFTAIILGGLAIFLYGGFIQYSFWILKEQTVRTNVGHVQIYDKAYFETSNKSKSIIANYEELKNEILNDPGLNKYISTISGQLEFTGVISHYESETSSYFSGLGIESLPSLKLGSFDKLVSGSDLLRIKTDQVISGCGLAQTLNAHYSVWLDVVVSYSQGGLGAFSPQVPGIFTS